MGQPIVWFRVIYLNNKEKPSFLLYLSSPFTRFPRSGNMTSSTINYGTWFRELFLAVRSCHFQNPSLGPPGCPTV